MYLQVNGGTKSRKKWTELAVHFSQQQLMPRRNNIFVQIDLVKNLVKDYGLQGDVYDLDNDDQMYVMRVDASLPPTDFIKTIIHEMVHVRQFCRKELKFNSTKTATGLSMHRFKKKLYASTTKYDNCPWEIEAHKLETPLLELFKLSAPTRLANLLK